MFTFFDFMYYLIYKWYADNEDSGSEAGGFCAVSGFQTFNILSVIWIGNYLFNAKELFLSKPFGATLIVVLMILNYIRYIRIQRFSKEAIRIKWERKSPEYQKDFRGYMTTYIVVTLMVIIALIAYSARKKM